MIYQLNMLISVYSTVSTYMRMIVVAIPYRSGSISSFSITDEFALSEPRLCMKELESVQFEVIFGKFVISTQFCSEFGTVVKCSVNQYNCYGWTI